MENECKRYKQENNLTKDNVFKLISKIQARWKSYKLKCLFQKKLEKIKTIQRAIQKRIAKKNLRLKILQNEKKLNEKLNLKLNDMRNNWNEISKGKRIEIHLNNQSDKV